MGSPWYRGAQDGDGDALASLNLRPGGFVECFTYHEGSRERFPCVGRIKLAYGVRDHGQFITIEHIACNDGHYAWWSKLADHKACTLHVCRSEAGQGDDGVH